MDNALMRNHIPHSGFALMLYVVTHLCIIFHTALVGMHYITYGDMTVLDVSLV